jgi:hypothetical protein
MYVQNLERRIDDTIITSPELFAYYNIYEL